MGEQTTGSSSASKRWVRRLGKGETLFKEGDTDRRVYVLVDGKVEVLQQNRRVAVVGVGETFIGEISALTGHPRSATVRTLKESTLLVVDEVEDLFVANVKWSLQLARVLAERLLSVSKRLERAEQRLKEMRDDQADVPTEAILTSISEALSAVDEEETLGPAV
jgi:CRP-like cAMP-binding protein